MTKKKNEKNKKNPQTKKQEIEQSFFYKYKNDKRYKAKVELIGYTTFILLIILFINISNLGSNPTNNNLINNISSNKINQDLKEENLLEKLDNNYQYDININITKITEETILYHYYGKSYNNTLEINKEFQNNNTTYYKVDDYYYKLENEEHTLINDNEIYDLVNKDYIELNNLLTLINEASLDHVTNYSSGKKEYVYTLYLRDIIINHKTEETVSISLVEENETLSIFVDYTNLIKEIVPPIKECKINYIFSNIGKVEEFFSLEQNEGGLNE